MAEFVLENTFWDATVTAYRSAYEPTTGKLWICGCDAQGNVTQDIIAPDGTTQRIRAAALGAGGASGDDHNSGAVIIVVGQVPITFYTRHNIETVVRYVRGSANSENAFVGTLQTAQSIAFGSIATTITHVPIQVVGTNLHVWTRIQAGSPSNSRYYGYATSADWGGTWSTPVRVFDAGSGSFYYPNMSLAADGHTCRIVSSTETADVTHNNIRYCEVNLSTGAIATSPGGSSVGNLDGTNLPILTSAMSVARQAPAGVYRSLRDVGPGSDLEMAWVEFDSADPQATSMYWYGIWNGSAWVHHPICTAGRQFGQGAQGGYHGGISFTGEASGKVILSRRASDGTWTIERWSTLDQGVTWNQDKIVASANESTDGIVALARPYQIGGGTGTYKAIYGRIERYGTDWEDSGGYTDWRAHLIATTE